MKRTLVFLMVLAMIVSMLAAVPFAASADDGSGEAAPVWSGKANIKWYVDALAEDPNATEFHLKTAEDLAGFSYLVNAYYDKNTRKTCYNGLWYDGETGEVLGFIDSGAETKYRFNYELLGFYIPRTKVEGMAYSYTQSDGIYRPLYSDDQDDPVDGSVSIAGTEFYGKTIYLDADLVLNEGDASTWGETAPANVWMPIGGGRNIDTKMASFSGVFYGGGHTISGLYFSETENNSAKVALFGHLAQGGATIIQDLVVENSYLEGYREIGAIVGRTDGAVTLINCHVKNSFLKGTADVGGVSGAVHEGAITLDQCSALNIWVEAQRSVGGLISNVDWKPMVVTDCIITGTVKAYAVSETNGGWDVGVLVGRMSEGSITVTHVISVVTLIQEGMPESDGKSSYSASAGVVYGAVSKKDSTTYNPKPTLSIEGYYYVDKIQANGTIIPFEEATKIVEEVDLTGKQVKNYVMGFDFDEVWAAGGTGAFPYLQNAGKATVDSGSQSGGGEEIDHVTQHEWFPDNWVSEKKATCEKEGTKGHYHCSCTKNFDSEHNELTDDELTIPALGHTYGELIPEKAATADAEGEKAHYECSTCHKLFDENKNPVTRADITIPKTEKKGCFGVVAGVPFVAAVVLGAVVLMRKKEEKNK